MTTSSQPADASRSTAPLVVRRKLGPSETIIRTLVGGGDAGFVLTTQRVLAWRGRGVGTPMPLADIDRVLLEVRAPEAMSLLLLVAVDRAAPPLVLALHPAFVPAAQLFAAALRDAVEAAQTELGSITAVEQVAVGAMSITQIRVRSGPR